MQYDCWQERPRTISEVSKSYSDNCTCSLTEQNTTLKKSVLWSDTNVKQNMILKIAIRFCKKIYLS